MNARLHVPGLLVTWLAGLLVFTTQWSRPTSPSGLVIGGVVIVIALVAFARACRVIVRGRYVQAYVLAFAPGCAAGLVLRFLG